MYRDRLGYIIYLLAPIFYFWGMTVLALSILRYMVAAMGFIIIFSAISTEWVITRWNDKIGKTNRRSRLI